MFCGLCVEACPYDALHMGSGFEEGSYTRTALVIDVDQLKSAPKRPSTWFRPQIEAKDYNPREDGELDWTEVGRPRDAHRRGARGQMGEEVVLVTEIAFWVIAVSTIVAAVAVVQAKDIFRAALFLAVAFMGVAGAFVLLRAEFLAVVQIIIYVGAITVLLVFAILMTRDVAQGNPTNRIGIPAAGLAALFFGVAAFVMLNQRLDPAGRFPPT